MSVVSETHAALERPEVQAFVSFLRAHSAVTRQLDRELVAEHGLTINDYEVLLRLARSPDRMMRPYPAGSSMTAVSTVAAADDEMW